MSGHQAALNKGSVNRLPNTNPASLNAVSVITGIYSTKEGKRAVRREETKGSDVQLDPSLEDPYTSQPENFLDLQAGGKDPASMRQANNSLGIKVRKIQSSKSRVQRISEGCILPLSLHHKASAQNLNQPRTQTGKTKFKGNNRPPSGK